MAASGLRESPVSTSGYMFATVWVAESTVTGVVVKGAPGPLLVATATVLVIGPLSVASSSESIRRASTAFTVGAHGERAGVSVLDARRQDLRVGGVERTARGAGEIISASMTWSPAPPGPCRAARR
jgi:hypothetical protein